MQWLIDIIQEWVQAQGYLTSSFVNRGDPAAYDLVVGDYTQNGAWWLQPIDHIVPAGASAVCLFFKLRSVGVGGNFEVKPSFNANDFVSCSQVSQVADLNIGLVAVLALDANRVFSYRATAGAFNRINTAIIGWWL